MGKAELHSLALTLCKELVPAGIHRGTVTIAGQIQPGTLFDSRRIAEAFWKLHLDPHGSFRAEVVFKG